MKQPRIYKMKDGLHELGVKGISRVIFGQLFCEDFLVIMKEYSKQTFREH